MAYAAGIQPHPRATPGGRGFAMLVLAVLVGIFAPLACVFHCQPARSISTAASGSPLFYCSLALQHVAASHPEPPSSTQLAHSAGAWQQAPSEGIVHGGLALSPLAAARRGQRALATPKPLFFTTVPPTPPPR